MQLLPTVFVSALLIAAIALSVRWVIPRRAPRTAGMPRWQWWSYLVSACALVAVVVVASLRAAPVAGHGPFPASIATTSATTVTAGAPGQLLVRMVLLRRLDDRWEPLAYAEERCLSDQAGRLEISYPDAAERSLGVAVRFHGVFLIPAWSALHASAFGPSAPLGGVSYERTGLLGQSMQQASVSLDELLETHGGHLERLNWSEPPLGVWEALAVVPPHRLDDLAVYLGAQELTTQSTLRQEPLDGAWVSRHLAQQSPPTPHAQGGLAVPVASPIANPGLALLMRLHLAGCLLVISSCLLCRLSPRPYLSACACAIGALLLTIALDRVMVAYDLQLQHEPRSSEGMKAAARSQARGSCYFQGLVARALDVPAPRN